MLEKFTWATLKRQKEKEGKRRCKKVHKLLQPWGSVWVLRGYLFCFSIKMCNRPTGPITYPLDPLPLLNKGSTAEERGDWQPSLLQPKRSYTGTSAHCSCSWACLPPSPFSEKMQRQTEAAGSPDTRVAAKKYIMAVNKCELSFVHGLKWVSWTDSAKTWSWDAVSSNRKGLMVICVLWSFDLARCWAARSQVSWTQKCRLMYLQIGTLKSAFQIDLSHFSNSDYILGTVFSTFKD